MINSPNLGANTFFDRECNCIFQKQRSCYHGYLGHRGEKSRHKSRAQGGEGQAVAVTRAHAGAPCPPQGRDSCDHRPVSDTEERRDTLNEANGPRAPRGKHCTAARPPTLTENSSSALGLSLREGRSLIEQLRDSLAKKVSCKALKTDSCRGLAAEGRNHLFRSQSKMAELAESPGYHVSLAF